MNIMSSRDRRDSGNALVSFVMAVPLIALLVTFSLNVAKNVNQSVAINAATQESTQVAVKSLNDQGYLGEDAVFAFVNAYVTQENAAEGGSADLNASDQKSHCGTDTVDGAVRTLPYMQITLYSGRATSSNANSSAPASSTPSTGYQASQTVYVEGDDVSAAAASIDKQFNGGQVGGVSGINATSIAVVVYTASPNFFLMPGFPSCQVYRSTASAVEVQSVGDSKSR